MFDIGFSEILLIFGLTLVVLGPDKLPHVARTVGRWVGRARTMARQFRDQLEAETDSLKVDINLNPPTPPMPPHYPGAPGAPATPAPPAEAQEPVPTPAPVAAPAPVSDPSPSTSDPENHDRRE